MSPGDYSSWRYIFVDILYYGFYYLLSFCPSPSNVRLWKQRREECYSLKESVLQTISKSKEVESITIVIPTYNEEKHLESTLQAALEGRYPQSGSPHHTIEIIVSDGGSSDLTQSICENYAVHGVLFVRGGTCRAECQNIGAKRAKNDIILFLHADTILPGGYSSLVIDVMRDTRTIIGAFPFDVDNKGLRGLHLLRSLVHFRSHYMSLPYGDQALFCRRAVFDALGGFPLVPLMEDYDFVQRVRKLSVGQIRIALNDASNYKTGRDLCSVTTSARRWEVHGVVWTTLINQIVIFGRNIGVPHDVLAKWYYGLTMKRNY